MCYWDGGRPTWLIRRFTIVRLAADAQGELPDGNAGRRLFCLLTTPNESLRGELPTELAKPASFPMTFDSAC